MGNNKESGPTINRREFLEKSAEGAEGLLGLLLGGVVGGALGHRRGKRDNEEKAFPAREKLEEEIYSRDKIIKDLEERIIELEGGVQKKIVNNTKNNSQTKTN